MNKIYRNMQLALKMVTTALAAFAAPHSRTSLWKKSDMKFFTKIVKLNVYPVTILILRGVFQWKFYEKTDEATIKTSTFHADKNMRFLWF